MGLSGSKPKSSLRQPMPSAPCERVPSSVRIGDFYQLDSTVGTITGFCGEVTVRPLDSDPHYTVTVPLSANNIIHQELKADHKKFQLFNVYTGARIKIADQKNEIDRNTLGIRIHYENERWVVKANGQWHGRLRLALSTVEIENTTTRGASRDILGFGAADKYAVFGQGEVLKIRDKVSKVSLFVMEGERPARDVIRRYVISNMDAPEEET
jgi:hypothetical protein